MSTTTIIYQLEETIQTVKVEKEQSDSKARNWAVVNTELEKVLAYVKTYCVEDEDEN